MQWILITTDAVAYPKHLETFVTNEHFYLNKLSVNVVLGGEGGGGQETPSKAQDRGGQMGVKNLFCSGTTKVI